MSLRIYNTLKGKKEDFIPVNKGKVGMYVCGPTVYDTSHIGHARSVVVFDIVFRWFKHLSYEVLYVRNFTDVDDKIIKKSNETGEECTVITEKYIKEFHNEMDSLNVLRPDVEPKATEHINHIIKFIEKLIEKGKAYYIEGGDVYFSIESFKEYGKLSNRNVEDMKAGARIAVDENKRSPFDFTLWKPAKEGEPFWESPWGNGRPGWHIECSAMSYEYLNMPFDIHGGGKDLIFPHHENEIAQSEALYGRQFVKYWMHNGFVDINNEKMSKSLGNFTMIKEVLAKYPAEAIRFFLLSKHYRSPIDYNEDFMKEVTVSLDRVYTFLERAEKAGAEINDSSHGPLWDDFTLAMNDDFNSARAIASVFDSVKKGNTILDQNDQDINQDIHIVYSDLRKMGEILGIFLLKPSEYFEQKNKRVIEDQKIDPKEIDGLILERNEARANKDFAKADEIRDQLQAMNIVLKDGPEGTTWKTE
ncbi:MAG: cysteine--tRNA ligase [Desulfobacteraceae bacterium]|nr:cysteine--tRNA ligase [Desulfobacteraceae bacterium]